MVQLRCQNCGRTVTSDIPEKKWRKAKCTGCKEVETFEIVDSDDDTWEDEEESEEDEEDEESNDDNEEELYACNVCEKEDLERDKGVFLNPDYDGDADSFTCKKCIDKAYPRGSDTKIEYREVEKIVHVPVQVDKDGNRVESENKPLFQKLF